MSVITHVKRSGNSLAFHLPKSFAEAHHLDTSLRFRMDFEGGRIVIEPVANITDEEAEHDQAFELLLVGMTPGTVDISLLKDGPVGQEML